MARNQKQNRSLSSRPKHKITWPEHLNWWLKSGSIKFTLKKNGIPMAYHWIKKVKDLKGDFIITGWFLNGQPKDKLRIASEILKAQYQSVKKYYSKIPWIITLREEHKFVERLNYKIGFKNASAESIKRISNIYLNTDKKFKYMEMLT